MPWYRLFGIRRRTRWPCTSTRPRLTRPGVQTGCMRRSYCPQHLWHQFVFLLVSAERDQRMACQGMDTDGYGDCGPSSGDLFENLQINLVWLTAAAPFLGTGQAQQSRLTESGGYTVGGGLTLLRPLPDRRAHL